MPPGCTAANYTVCVFLMSLVLFKALENQINTVSLFTEFLRLELHLNQTKNIYFSELKSISVNILINYV